MHKHNLTFAIIITLLFGCDSATETTPTNELLNNIEMRVNNGPVDTVTLDPAELDAFFAKPTVSYSIKVADLDLYLPFHYEAFYDDRVFFPQLDTLDKLVFHNNPNILLNIRLKDHIYGPKHFDEPKILLIKTDDPTAITIEGLKSQLAGYNIIYFDDHGMIFEGDFSKTYAVYFKYLPERASFLIYISIESLTDDTSNQTEWVSHNLKKIRMAKNLLIDKTPSSPTWDDHWESLSDFEKKVFFSAANRLKAIDHLEDNKTYHFKTYQEKCLFSLTTDQKKIAALMNGAKKLPTNPQTTVLAEEIFGKNTMSPFMHIYPTDEIRVISLSKNRFTLTNKNAFNRNNYVIFHQTAIYDRQVLLFNGCVDSPNKGSYQYFGQLDHAEMTPFYAYFFENIPKFLTDEITLEIE